MSRNTHWTEQQLIEHGWKEDTKNVFVPGSYPSEVVTPLPPKPKVKLPKPKPLGLVSIEGVLRTSSIYYETELRFHPERKWRFDLVVPELRLAIEYEGIFSGKSRHTGMRGYTEDANKYNAAQLLGWRVLRYTAKNYKNFVNDLQQLLTNK